MFLTADNRRPRAGSRFAGLAVLAVLTLLGAPLATAGHHHAEGASPDADANCSVCLWQAHGAADLADAPHVAVTAASRLEQFAVTRQEPSTPRSRLSVRAPPSASV